MSNEITAHLEPHEQAVFAAIERGQLQAQRDFEKWRKKYEETHA